tara:strand:+ start:49 stop:243 length:195 start_codon:yes stop_codon:yes gene_type:complete
VNSENVEGLTPNSFINSWFDGPKDSWNKKTSTLIAINDHVRIGVLDDGFSSAKGKKIILLTPMN